MAIKAYPAHQDCRSGCKVSWLYYSRKADAEACARAARHNMRILESQEYDFGYCAPGNIVKVDRGELGVMFEVCIP